MLIKAILSESAVQKRKKSNNRVVNAKSFKSKFTKQLMPVQLEPELMQEYEDIFYPSFDKDKTKHNAAVFTDISKYLAKLQFGIDAMLTFAIHVCAKSVDLTAMAASRGNSMETFAAFRSQFDRGLTMFPPLASVSDDATRLLRCAMNDTSNVIIKESKRYSGGKAIINVPFDNKFEASPAFKVGGDPKNTMSSTFRVAFTRQKNSSGNFQHGNVFLPSADGGISPEIDHYSHGASVTLPMYTGGRVDDDGNPRHEANEEELTQYYSTYKMPLAQAVVSVVARLHETIGQFNRKSVVNNLPFSYDFTVFDKMLRASHPSMAFLMPESGFFFANDGLPLPDDLADTFTIGLRVHLGKRVLELLQGVQPLKDEKPSYEQRTGLVKSKALLQALGSEYKVLSSSIMVGYQIDIKPEFVDFITQGHNDKAAYLLNTWIQDWVPSLFRLPGTKNGAGFDDATAVADLARTVSLPSDIISIRKARDKFGFLSADSVGDEDGLIVNADGSFAVHPRYSEIDTDDVKKTEGLLNNNIEAVYSHNLPAFVLTGASRDATFAFQRNIDASDVDGDEVDNSYDKVIEGHNAVRVKVASSVMLSDPSMHLLGTISPDNPYRSKTKELISKHAGVLEHADILGFDFSKEGESTLVKSIQDALNLVATPGSHSRYETLLMNRPLSSTGGSLEATLNLRRNARYGRSHGAPTTDASTVSYDLMEIAMRVASSYAMFEMEGLCPPLATLVAEAIQTVKDTYPEFQGESVNDSDLDEGHYTEYFSGMTPENLDSADIIAGCFDQALLSASGWENENLYRIIREEIGADTTYLKQRISEHPAGINFNAGLGELSKLNNYFGGALFFAACSHIAKADRKSLFNLTRKAPSELKIGYKPSADYLIQYLLPTAIVFSKDVQHAEQYWDAAKEEQAKSDPNAKNRDPEHMKIYGSKGFQYFPHQWEAMQALMGFPEYAILDVAPGGGKTNMGLTDMMMIASAMLDEGKRLRPVVVAPNGLVKNWCTDLKISTKGWNVIPIRNDTLERWNMDSLVKLISNSPPNTIVVVANHFIANANQSAEVNIGGQSVRISSTTEFVIRLGFNYVILDESHKAKNLDTALNQSLRKIFNAPTVLYKRIATGTLYPDRVDDAIGQASLLSPAILGTKPTALSAVTEKGQLVVKQLTLNEIGKIRDDNERAAAFRAAGKAIRNRLAAYTSLITKRKKDWSYILPTKLDTFILVELDDPDVPDADLHAAAYQQVVEDANKTLQEEATKREKENKAKAKRIKAKLDQGDEEDDDEVDPEMEGMDSDFAALYAKSGGGLVRTKFDALEMLITSPIKHETAIQMWADAKKDITKFVSSKLRAMIERIDLHFKVTDYDKDKFDKEGSGGVRFNWVQGCEPYELDICVYNGTLYLARKLPPKLGDDGKAIQEDLIRRKRLPPSNIPPDQDLDYWKPEREGKILIITGFHSTIASIEEALPQKYKAQTVTFHGKNSKAKNERALEQFNNDPNIKIIIAMEKSITEGYNMQAGSRMIRIDNPWNSGTYEQTVSRIMRPDHKGYNFEGGRDGDLHREVINVDWIMANKTIDVGKVAMLQQKTIETDMMYEDDNPNYQGVLEYLSLAKINLGIAEILDGTIFNFESYKSTEKCRDPKDLRWRHFEARAKITNVQSFEFAELRRTKPPVFVDIPEQAPHPTFRILDNLPTVPGQEPATDANNYGLMSFYNWYRQQDEIDPWPTDANTVTEFNRSGAEIRSRVVGLPVVTEYGNATIAAIKQVNKSDVLDDLGNKVGFTLSGIPFNKITITVGQGKTAHNVDVDVSLIYVATAVNASNKKMFLSKQPSISAGNVDGEEQVPMTDEDMRNLPPDSDAPREVTVTPSSTKTDDEEEERKEVEEQASADAKKAAQEGSGKRRIKDKVAQAIQPDVTGQRPENPVLPDVTDTVDIVPESELPDVQDGVEVVPETPAATPRVRVPKAKPTLDVQVMVYNGVVALYVNDGSEEDAGANALLEKYGFAKFNSFAYVDVHNGRDFFKVIDHLENENPAQGDLFTLDKPSENRLNHIQYAFEHKNAMKFNYLTAYANREDMVDFFQTLHRKVKASAADTQLKLYPAFMGDRIRLMVDLTTCPAAKKLINHKYAGITPPFGKWMKHAAMHVNFETTPRKAVALLNKLSTKFEIAGLPEIIDEVMTIQVKPEAQDK